MRTRSLDNIRARCVVHVVFFVVDELIYAQGTWQFISVARLLDPWSTPHQISDDLESFFWVLLYQIVRGRDRKKQFRQAMEYVFDQYESVKGNRSRGGRGKLSTLKGTDLPTQVIMGLTFRTPCCAMIEELRSLFNNSYLYVTYEKAPEPEVAAMYAKMMEEDPKVEEARKNLQSSDAFLAILERHLNPAWDINDDGSVDPSDPLQDPSASRNRRKRPASDSDEGLNFHQRRRGLMPPRSTERPRSGLSSQTPSSRGSDWLFSGPSRTEILSGSAPSDSPRPSDEGLSAKR